MPSVEAPFSKRVALVTGASSGLGREFVRQLDSRSEFAFDEIWLIARRADPMLALARELRRTRGVVVTADLAVPSHVEAIGRRLENERAEVAVLVNNAGFGKAGPFAELGAEEQLRMIDVDVRALAHLTAIALPRMRHGGAIVQVASSIAFAPAPNFAVYAAAKSFVLSFTDAVGYELRSRGIRAIAVCPGPVRTEFFEVAGRSEARPSGRVPQASELSSLMAEPRDVVTRAFDDLRRGRTRSVYGFWIRAFAALARFVPREALLRAIAGRRAKP